MFKRARGKRKVFFSILTALLTLIVFVLVFEVVLRIIYREEEANGNYWGIGAFSHHDLTTYFHAPGFEGYAFRAGTVKSHVKINSLGLRQAELEQQLQYTVKLLILGDSMTFGLGVSEEQSFPSLIKKDLNALNIGVVNGGQAGYCVEQERLFGMSLIQRLKPGIVILGLFPGNDIRGDYYKEYLDYEVKYGYRLRKDRWLKFWAADFLRTHSYLWMYMERKLNIKKWKKKVAHFKTMLKKRPLKEVMQPTLNTLAKLRDYCEKNRILFGIVMIPPRYGKTIFDKPLRAFFQEEKIALLDLGSKGYSKKDYLKGDGHWNEKGHQKASQFLVPFVVKLLEKRRE